MSRKAFLVQVELDVQAVTCPGVWLCSNGRVSLQIYMLDSCVQTTSYKPTFPIKCNETFAFYKTFYTTHRLNELQEELHDQWVYVELVQWQSCETGNVLATFHTTLDELLYPSTASGSIAGVDLDLLMEPSKTFPGTIAPKIEVSTKTTIEETLCKCTKPMSSTVIVNPKVLTSAHQKTRNKRNVCRKVCHSVMYSKRKLPFKVTKTKPPFCYRKAEDDLILRKPQYDLNANYCQCKRRARSLERQKCTRTRTRKPESPGRVKICACGCTHKENVCPVCSKYSGYFNVSPVTLSPRKEQPQTLQTQPRTTLFSPNRRCFGHPKSDTCPCCRPMAFATSENKWGSGASDASGQDMAKLCCCMEQKPSLAEKLHARLTKTLSAMPKSIEWSCYDYDYECDCCECPSRGEMYRNLQKIYGDLYEKTRPAVNALCVPDCPGYK